MHELSIVESLVEQIEREVDRSGHGGRVRRLELRIGRLSGVNCESLRFAFELLAVDTRIEGAEIDIEEPPAISTCHDCNAKCELDELLLKCPKCDSTNVTVDGGREMLLESIELDD